MREYRNGKYIDFANLQESLKKFLEAGSFNMISIDGFQRYPFLNHFKWILFGKPSGYIKQRGFLNGAYASLLKMLNKTDTLVAIARK